MSAKIPNSRMPEAHVDSIFTDRWSPRAFLDEPLPEYQVAALFEAARWSPSCYNEQPWRILYATKAADRRVFCSLLTDKNQRWACNAPLLLFILARKHFGRNNRINRHAAFDAGAAWMALALQARRFGLYAHAMAGFDVDRAHEVLNVSRKRHEIMAAVAVGRRGDPNSLPEDLYAMEQPNDRKPLTEIASDRYSGRSKR